MYTGKEIDFTKKGSCFLVSKGTTPIEDLAVYSGTTTGKEIGNYEVQYDLLYPDSFVWVDDILGKNPTTEKKSITYSIKKRSDSIDLYFDESQFVFPYDEGVEWYFDDIYYYGTDVIQGNCYEITGVEMAEEPGEYQTTISIFDEEHANKIKVYDYTKQSNPDAEISEVSSITINWKIVDNYEKYVQNQSPQIGDIDGDKDITILDVRLLLQSYINSTPSTSWDKEDLDRMDIDGNGSINIIDVRLLLQMYINN